MKQSVDLTENRDFRDKVPTSHINYIKTRKPWEPSVIKDINFISTPYTRTSPIFNSIPQSPPMLFKKREEVNTNINRYSSINSTINNLTPFNNFYSIKTKSNKLNYLCQKCKKLKNIKVTPWRPSRCIIRCDECGKEMLCIAPDPVYGTRMLSFAIQSKRRNALRKIRKLNYNILPTMTLQEISGLYLNHRNAIRKHQFYKTENHDKDYALYSHRKRNYHNDVNNFWKD